MMMMLRIAILSGLLAVGLIVVNGARIHAQDEPAKAAAGPNHWKAVAGSYRITLDNGQPVPLSFREEPVLKWTNPQRNTDDGAVFIWTDRGRPEVASSYYRYKSQEKPLEDHEFVSLSASPLTSIHEGDLAWSPPAGISKPSAIPDAPKPGATPAERLRQMRTMAREFRATFNNPPDLSEIRLLPQPIYRFETEGKRTDVLDGALFAYVHTTDPEVLLSIEARTDTEGGQPTWQYSIARMSLVNMRVHHKDREVWSASWVDNVAIKDRSKPYQVRTYPSAP